MTDNEAGDELSREFGTALREWRIKRGLTQEQFAELAGSSQSAVSRVENGAEGPTLPTCARLAEACRTRIKIVLLDAD